MTLPEDDPWLCHVCDGRRPAMDTCSACAGRGRITGIGFVGSPWDEVAPGLWVGGHDYVDGGGDGVSADMQGIAVKQVGGINLGW